MKKEPTPVSHGLHEAIDEYLRKQAFGLKDALEFQVVFANFIVEMFGCCAEAQATLSGQVAPMDDLVDILLRELKQNCTNEISNRSSKGFAAYTALQSKVPAND